MAIFSKKQSEQKPKRAKIVAPEDARNYVCIADDDEPVKPAKKVEEVVAPKPAPAPKPEPKKAPAKETVEEADERAQEEEFAAEEEPVEELATVEDVKAEEAVTLKQSLAVARHNADAGHKTQIGKKFCADYLDEKYKQNAETNRRENYTSTGLPLADTHYAVNDKKKKCI